MENYEVPKEITDEQLTLIRQSMENLATSLAAISVNVKTNERRTCCKMGPKYQVFCEKVLAYGKEHSNLFEGYVEFEKLEKYLNFRIIIRELSQSIFQLHENLEDTSIALGNAAFSIGSTGYKFFKTFAELGMKGMDSVVKDLGSHFKRKPASINDSNTTDNTNTLDDGRRK